MQVQIQGLIFQGANVLGGPPGPPGTPSASGVLGGGFTVNWAAVPGATGYRLDVSTSPVFASFVSGFNNLDVGNVLFYQVLGLTGGTAYYFRVRAYNTDGTSASSSGASQTTNQIAWTPPAAVVSWTDSGGAHSGDLATFLATPTFPTTTILNTTGAALTTLTDVSALPLISTIICTSVNTLDLTGVVTLSALGCGANPFSSISSSTLRSVSGAITLSSCTFLTSVSFPAIQSSGGFTVAGDTALTSLDLNSLATITGPLTLTGLLGLTSISLPRLTTAAAITLTGNDNLATLSMPSLVTCTSINAISLTLLTSMTFTSLVTVNGPMSFSNSTKKVLSVSFPALQTAATTFDFDNTGAASILESVSCPALLTVGNRLHLNGHVKLTSLSLGVLSAVVGTISLAGDNILSGALAFPSLTSVGSLTITGTALGSLSFPALLTVGTGTGGTVDLSANSFLTSVSLPVLTKMGTTSCASATALASFSAPSWVATKTATTYNWTGCVLPTANVNALLLSLAAFLPTIAGCTINIFNGVPSGAGAAAKTALQVGNTVNTN